jgi:hypothetical protein
MANAVLTWLVNLICRPVETLVGEKTRRMKAVRKLTPRNS